MPRLRGGGGIDDNIIDGVTFPPGVKQLSLDMNRNELLHALKKCCRCFSALEQGDERTMAKYKAFVDLLTQEDFLLKLKDSNCSVFLGCLITDIFRVYAPNNPFQLSDKQKEVFMFVTHQLLLLKDPKASSYHKAHHILSNLVTFKCYNICLELDTETSSQVFTDLFRTLLSTVNSGHDNNLKAQMLDVMVQAVTDSSVISQSLLDLILESLLEKSQKMNPSAFELSKELLRRTSSIVEQPIMTYFQNMAIANRPDSSKVTQWDKLVPIMYNISPQLLLNTLPQFELKLKVDNAQERKQTVRLFAQMFSAKDSDLGTKYNKLWKSFLGRFNDIDAEVRVACVNFYWSLLVNHGSESTLSKETLEQFKPRRHDPDEQVRLAVVCAIRGIAVHNLKLVSNDLLECLKDRVKDKKWKVREGAIRAMADIYKKYVTVEECLRVNVKRLQIFRNSLLHVYYHQGYEDVLLLERMLISSIIPYKLPEEKRMKLLLELYATVDDNALKAISEIVKNQRRIQLALHDVIKCFDITDDKKRAEAVWPKTIAVATLIPGGQQIVRENVKKFIRIAYQDGRIRQLLKYIVGEDYTCKKIETAVRDILKKMDNDGVSKQVRNVTQQILERCVILPIIIDSSALKTLFDLVKETLNCESDLDELNTDVAQQRAIGLLRLLSQLAPYIYNSEECYENLLSLMRSKEEIVNETLLIFQKTSSIVENKFPKIRNLLLPVLKEKAKNGTSKQAKRSVYCISEMSSISQTALVSIFDYCKEAVQSEECNMARYQTLFTSMGCIAQVLPSKVSIQLRNVIATVVVKQVIMKTTTSLSTLPLTPSKTKKNSSNWSDKKLIGPESKAKIAGMKCMVRWLQGMKSNESNVCGSTLRLLQHVLHNNGDLMKTGNIAKNDMCHLRLQSACCILKIAQVHEYRDLFKPETYQELAMLVNDPELEIRRIFVNRLYSSLMCLQINISFLSLFAMVSQEANKNQRTRGTALYHQLIKRFREFNKEKGQSSGYSPEYMLPYLIYLLADDPDFIEGISKRSLARINDCVQFALEPLLTKNYPESFGFIKRLADCVKRTKNAETPDDDQRNENIYAVCDLVSIYVIRKSAQYAVGVIEPDDKSIAKYIPSRLFTAITGGENKTCYLPREFYASLKKSIPTPNLLTTPSPQQKQQQKKIQQIRKLPPVTVSSPSTSKTKSSPPSAVKPPTTPTKPPSSAGTTPTSSPSPTKSSSIITSPTTKMASPKHRDTTDEVSMESEEQVKQKDDSSCTLTPPDSQIPSTDATTSTSDSQENNKKRPLLPPVTTPPSEDKLRILRLRQPLEITGGEDIISNKTSGRKRKLPKKLEDSPSPERTPTKRNNTMSSPSKRGKSTSSSSRITSSPSSTNTKKTKRRSILKSESESSDDEEPLSSLVTSQTSTTSSSNSRKQPVTKKTTTTAANKKTKTQSKNKKQQMATRVSKRNR